MNKYGKGYMFYTNTYDNSNGKCSWGTYLVR